MSWNGTVHCGYCREKGHNQRGCEEYKNVKKERYERALNTPEGDRSYYDNRTIQDWEAAEQKKSTPRKCSYCSEHGHNRRSCEPLKEHMECVLKQERAFRTAFVDHLSDIGLNIGSLILPHDQSDDRRNYIDNVPHLVTKIRWENISICEARQSIDRFVIARPVSNLINDRNVTAFNIKAPEHWPTGERWNETSQRWQEEHYGLNVISGTPGIEPPAGWFEDKSKVKEFFKDRESWMWPSDNNVSDYYRCDWWILEENQELEKIA